MVKIQLIAGQEKGKLRKRTNPVDFAPAGNSSFDDVSFSRSAHNRTQIAILILEMSSSLWFIRIQKHSG